MYHDIVFIGCGFRTVSFLLSDKSLLNLDVCIIERSDKLGTGKFSDLDCLSNSSGATFLRHLNYETDLSDNALIKAMRSSNSPVYLDKIAEILKLFGDEIRKKLPDNCLLNNTSVLSINIRANNPYPLEFELAGGTYAYGKFCILGTGQAEILHPQLLPWLKKTWLSGRFLSVVNRTNLIAKLNENSNTRIVILGCSHSSFACVKLLCNLLAKIKNHQCQVEILQRRKVHIYYSTLKDALLNQNDQYEELANEQYICTETGEVFKDSGLKYEAKEMYREICSGKYDFIHMRQINDLVSCSFIFDECDLIVQATGLQSIFPTLKFEDEIICKANDVRNLTTDDRGFLHHKAAKIDGLIAQLRVMQTPEQYIDKAIYNRELYKNLGEFLITNFQSSRVHEVL